MRIKSAMYPEADKANTDYQPIALNLMANISYWYGKRDDDAH